MKYFIFIPSLILVNLFNLYSQIPSVEWQKCLGGTEDDYGRNIKQTNDGGFIVVGYSDSNNGDVSGNHGSDYWVVKLEIDGSIEWQKCLGGSTTEQAYDVQQTTDNGFVIVGYSNSNDGDVTGNHGYGDYWVVKLDSSGTIQWQKSLGGSDLDYAYSIIQTNDSGYLLAGFTNSYDGDVSENYGESDYWIVKLSAIGDLEWERSFGGSTNDQAYSVIQAIDNNFIIAGISNSKDGDISDNHDNYDYWIIKVSTYGDLIWSKSYGGSEADLAYSIKQTSDGGFVISGYSDSDDGDITESLGQNNFWVLKIDSLGSIQWDAVLGGSKNDYSYNVIQITDGGFVASGSSLSSDYDVDLNYGDYDYLIIKLNPEGDTQWVKTIGGSQGDIPYAIVQTPDYGFAILGSTESNDIDISGNHGNLDYWVLKLSSEFTEIHDLSITIIQFSLCPNPATNYISIQLTDQFSRDIQLSLINQLGEKILEKDFTTIGGQAQSLQLNIESIPSGIYFIRVNDKENNLGEMKFVKM